MVVTEMKTPIRAPARASVSETAPTIPASTATITENRLGLLIRSETGRIPAEYSLGVFPDQRIARAKSRVRTMAAQNPASSASRPRDGQQGVETGCVHGVRADPIRAGRRSGQAR